MTEQTLSQFIDQTQEQFLSVAPQGINYEAEKDFAMQILTSNDWLMRVATSNKRSLLDAVKNVASIGLSLNPAEKQAYLISRRLKVGDNYVDKICLEPSYIGLCRLATNSGSIEWVQAKTVYSSDEFLDNGVGKRPTHTYNAFSKERGDFVGVYCVAKTHKGDYLTTIMDADQIDSIKVRSEAYKAYTDKKRGNGGPWVTDFEEMAKKSVIRNAFKTWPSSVTVKAMAEAVHISNENEGFEPLVTAPKILDFTADQKNYFDQLIEKSDALSMYVFSQSFDLNDASGKGASIWTNLLHSFPKGQKGKYQRLVDQLRSDGESQFFDVISEIEAQIGQDDYAIKELLVEFDNDTIQLILKTIPYQMESELKRIIGELHE